MFRALALATLVVVLPAAAVQELGVLHIKVVLVDAARGPMPVPRHALLISDNPATALPRRVVTASDGTVDVRLAPGSYTVESDRPVALGGKAYQWTEIVRIAAGRDTVVELTARNAEIGTASATTPSPTAPAAALENDPALLLPRWKDSVVALWTATTRASGFVVDAAGIIVTNQRDIRSAAVVEVQLTPVVKVPARVLVNDPDRDVAVLWIDPAVTASVRPIPLDCGHPVMPPLAAGQTVVAIGAPLRGERDLSLGSVVGVDPRAIVADFNLAPGMAGGPVFTEGGAIAGISSVDDDRQTGRPEDIRVVPIDVACDAVRSAREKMQAAAPPVATRLPVEMAPPFPRATLEAAVRRRTGSLGPYQMSSSDFDVAFITPVLTLAARHRAEQASERQDPDRAPGRDSERGRMRWLTDFGDWSNYVTDAPPVLLIRVTPKFEESLWTTLARGAARTQGVSLPPIRHFKAGFSRLHAFCGETDVTPIHPFALEQRVSESDAIREGLYVFDPDALVPRCGSVKLVLYSEKQPDKGEVLIVSPMVIEQIWQDFEPFRTPAPSVLTR